MKSVILFLVSALLFPAAALAQDAEEAVFTFYGLKFGMSEAAALEVFPRLDANLVREPGHGMSSLALFFDREDRLIEIRASYAKPEGKLEDTGLKRALREKFVAPVRENFPDISTTMDEFGNRAATTIVFQSTGLREMNIEYFKKEFLNKME